MKKEDSESGARAAPTCSQCGSPYQSQDNFCASCGSPLSGESTVTEGQQATFVSETVGKTPFSGGAGSSYEPDVTSGERQTFVGHSSDIRAQLALKVTAGPMVGREFVYHQHDAFLFGRASDCHAAIADDPCVSRHHFLLETNPPEARLRDLGSLNGTYVNQRRIGGRRADETPEQARGKKYAEVNLNDGDQIHIGGTALSVHISGHTDLGDGQDGLMETAPGDGELPLIPGYRVQRELGRGGIGVVYKAIEERTGQQVAIKVLLPRKGSKESSFVRFEREIGVLMKLQHPNIVRCLRRGRIDSAIWMVMEYCAAGDLRNLLRNSGGALEPPKALPLALEMLDGLAHAHEAGLVHRDIKPENLLLSKEFDGIRLKIADFGLAKSFVNSGLSGFTLTGDVQGTFHFMPPEQVVNFKHSRPVSDLWSAAATLYLLLVGRYPRQINPGQDPIQAVLEEPVVSLMDCEPKVPSPLAEVVDRALDREPGRRYQTAHELTAALHEAAAQSGIELH